MAWNEPGDRRPEGDKGQDPWGQKPKNHKPSDQPPDLNEVFGQFFDKMSELLGAKPKKGGAGGGAPKNPGGSNKSVIIVGLLLAAVAYGIWGFTTIVDGESGVLQQFGNYKKTVMPGPTFVFKPFQKLTVVNVQNVRKVDNISERQDNREMLTQDENIIIVKYEVQFNIASAEDFVFKVTNPVQTLRQSAESAIREIIGRNKLDYIVSEGRDAVAMQAKESIQKMMDGYQTGISVRNVNLTEAQYPVEVQTAIDDVTKAREDKARFINEAEAYRNQIVPEARGQAVKLIEEAKGYHYEMIKRAEGESQRFDALLAQYQKAPQVTRDRLYLEAMESVLGNSSKVIVDADNNNILYLPLDKIGSQNAAKAPETHAPLLPPAAIQYQPPATSTQPANNARSRQREIR